MNRERGALLRPDVETATRGAMLRAPTDRFMESSVFLSDLLTAHERFGTFCSFPTACEYGSWEEGTVHGKNVSH